VSDPHEQSSNLPASRSYDRHAASRPHTHRSVSSTMMIASRGSMIASRTRVAFSSGFGRGARSKQRWKSRVRSWKSFGCRDAHKKPNHTKTKGCFFCALLFALRCLLSVVVVVWLIRFCFLLLPHLGCCCCCCLIIPSSFASAFLLLLYLYLWRCVGSCRRNANRGSLSELSNTAARVAFISVWRDCCRARETILGKLVPGRLRLPTRSDGKPTTECESSRRHGASFSWRSDETAQWHPRLLAGCGPRVAAVTHGGRIAR